MAQIWNFPCRTASTTSGRSIRLGTFCTGIITPWRPVSPSALHTAKYPSIFSLTPPMGWISPFWLTEPDSDALLDRNSGQLGQQRIELGGTRAIPIHLRIHLLERQRRIQAERLLLGILAAQVRAQDGHAFAVDAARHLRFPFDIDDTAAADEGARGDPAGMAEAVVS